MTPDEVAEIEIGLVLEALWARHGYDFRHYARSSLKRRLTALGDAFGQGSISGLIPRLLHQPGFLSEVLASLSVPVTGLFRDPAALAALRHEVMPRLASYPHLSVWLAGCASGEEAYSLAVLLCEEGLLARARIFATDINDRALAQAEEGIYPLARVEAAEADYRAAGGRARLGDHLHVAYGYARFHEALRGRIVFAHHNLVSDGVFCEAHLILCRNVLIYFDSALQGRVLGLFDEALIRDGFLCLGSNESLRAAPEATRFRPFDPAARLFIKKEAVR
ncbi:CheR family methyltransferase [Phaeospirillum tilakii]|uniref:CheR family methyltransferase n=1 Tax=Phaeospirillum tilakii TaxID=741673 RepID=A0ABW5CE46_9PROT